MNILIFISLFIIFIYFTTVKTVEKVESVETVENVEKVENVETVENVEKVENVETVENVDYINIIIKYISKTLPINIYDQDEYISTEDDKIMDTNVIINEIVGEKRYDENGDRIYT